MPNTADATWTGQLKEGEGKVKLGGGAFEGNYTFKSRFEDGEGTNPEELIAAAHAACFGMALSNELSTRGHPPARLEIQATCTFEPGKGITTMALDVTADVPGVDEAGFREGLDAAEESCPVSNALRGNVDIQVEGRLG